MILGTDNSLNFVNLAHLKKRISEDFDPKEKDKKLLMKTILHAADLGNSIKPWNIC
jgi:hypothetical protein